ncbi:MAG: hypothetical protein V1934_08500 [Methanobacteriota archaeon]
MKMKSARNKSQGASVGFTNGAGKGFTNGAGKGFTNGSGKGMTNGLGRTNGLTNGSGRGMTNGVGRTNGLTNGAGRGMTNGVGRTNGLTNGLGGSRGFTNGMGGRFDDQGAIHPKKLSVILVVVLVTIVPISLALLATPQGVPGMKVQIDGKFGDWKHEILYTDDSIAPDAALDVTQFSAYAKDGYFFLRFKTQGVPFASARIDRFVALVDSDSNAGTGYDAWNLGAEYLFEVYGSGGTPSAMMSKFQGADRANWSAFATLGGGIVDGSDGEFEARVHIDDDAIGQGGYRLCLLTLAEGTRGETCRPIINGADGSLIVTQTSLAVNDIVTGGAVLQMHLKASGKQVVVNTLPITAQGATAALSGFTAGMLVNPDSPSTVTVSMDLGAAASGALVKASTGAIDADGPVSVFGKGLAASAFAAPAGLTIDGGFADWASIQKTSDAAADVANPNIDIVEEAAASQAQSFFAFVKFNGAGQAMAGRSIPNVRTVSSGGSTGGGTGGGVSVVPRVTGEDVTRIYVDSKAGGSNIGGIQADYVIEMRGRNGIVLTKNVFTHPARSLVGTASAEAGESALEASVPFALIGNPSGTIGMFVETTDWANNKDGASPIQAIPSLRTRSTSIEEIEGFGTAVVFNPATSEYIATAFDPSNGKVVVAYSDGGNFGLGAVVVGTVSGTGISFGTPVTFSSGIVSDVSVAYTTGGKVVIAYSDVTDSGKGTAVVGTVSGTSITTGMPAVFEPALTTKTSVTYDSAHTKVVIIYSDFGGFDYGNAVVGTVSGTDISFGTPAVFVSASLEYCSAAYDASSSNVVVAYSEWATSRFGTCKVGTVSGTSISFGAPTVFESATTEYISAVYCPSQGKVVVAYTDGGNALRGTAVVGTVSGTSISFGTPSVFETGTTAQISAAYDSSQNKLVVAYSDTGNLGYGTSAVGTVSGTSISFTTPEPFELAAITYTSSAFDSANGKVVIAYQDNGNSDFGTSIVMEVPEYGEWGIPIVFLAILLIVCRSRTRRGD